MKKRITLTHVLLIIFAVYYVVMDQIKLSVDITEGAEIKQHRKEKEQLQTKIHYYEVQKLKEHSIVDNATNSELDSLESVHRP